MPIHAPGWTRRLGFCGAVSMFALLLPPAVVHAQEDSPPTTISDSVPSTVAPEQTPTTVAPEPTTVAPEQTPTTALVLTEEAVAPDSDAEEDGGDADQEVTDVWEPIPGFTGGGPVIATNPIVQLGDAYDSWQLPVTVAGQAALAAAARAVAIAESDLEAYEGRLDEAREAAVTLQAERDEAIDAAARAAEQAVIDAQAATASQVAADEAADHADRERVATLRASTAVGRAAHLQDLSHERLLALRSPVDDATLALGEAARQLGQTAADLRELAISHYITNDVTADLPRIEPDGSDDVEHQTKRVSREAVLDLRERNYRTARDYEAEARLALALLVDERGRRQVTFDNAEARALAAVEAADLAHDRAEWARASAEEHRRLADRDRTTAERSAGRSLRADAAVASATSRIEAAERLIVRAENVLIAAGTQLGQLRSVADSRAASASQAAAGALVGADEVTFPIAGDWNFIDSWGFPRSDNRRHQGADIFAPAGTPLVAIEAGTVEISLNRLGGLVVYLDGLSGNRYYYAHLESVPDAISTGDAVMPGTVIGFVGASGNAAGTPPHLHFEVRPGGGAKVNPYPLLRALSGAVTEAQVLGAQPQDPDGYSAKAITDEVDGPTTAAELGAEIAALLEAEL